MLLVAADGLPDAVVAADAGCCAATVENLRRRFAAERPAALVHRPRPGAAPELDGMDAARLVAACRTPPAGRWTRTGRLLADRLVEVGGGRRRLRRNRPPRAQNSRPKPWRKRRWCLPALGAEFGWRAEGVPDPDATPPDPARPVVCLDGRPCRLLAHVRPPGAQAQQDPPCGRHPWPFTAAVRHAHRFV